MTDLDNIDRRILMELQLDGRISNAELAQRVGLAPTSMSDPGIGVAVDVSAASTESRFMLGFTSSMSATTPDIWGVAIDVPEMLE